MQEKKTHKLFWMDSMDLNVPQVSLRPEDKIKDGTSKESVIQWACVQAIWGLKL